MHLTECAQFGDYVFFNASLKGISPLDGFKQFLSNTSSHTKLNFAQGCELWSNDESQIAAAVETAQQSDVAIVVVSIYRTMLVSCCSILDLGWNLVFGPNIIVDSRNKRDDW